MHCAVLRSSLKAYTYLYLVKGQAFDDLPQALKKVFGKPEWVMDLHLTAERKLATEDIRQVMQNLSRKGYHLQLPPHEDPTGWLEL